MEPLVALSAAGTIVQFVEFGCKLLSEGRAFYNSSTGAINVNEELELITNDLQALAFKIRGSSYSARIVGPLAKAEQDDWDNLNRLCDGSANAAEELIDKLENLNVKGSRYRRLESLKKAIESAWTKEEVEELVGRLKSYREVLESHLLFSLR